MSSRAGLASPRRIGAALFLCCGFAAAQSDSSSEPPKTLPQSGLFSSLKQAVRQGYDHEAVRGYFVQGTPPNQHRYYCLVNVKTGQKESNAVLGEPMPLPSGMTGMKVNSVSLFLCADAEREGLLQTEGFVLNGAAARANAPATSASSAVKETAPPALATSAPAPSAPSSTAPVVASSAASIAPPPAAPPPAAAAVAALAAGRGPSQIDVAGLRLGMSPDEVRAVLRAKNLREYRESAETLSGLDRAQGTAMPLANGRFVNVIAAWSAPPAASADNFQSDGESYEVMFTPVPGRERVVAIIHTLGYSPSRAIRETALETALAKKYGGASAVGVTQSPTWRLLAGGTVESGDSCARRGTFGGLSGLNASAARENIALKLSADELRFQVEHCGLAIVTEDQFAANGGALHDDRMITRFTVTAYSPSIALDGAKAAAQLIQSASVEKPAALAAKTQGLPEL